jgi:hypothetical protein
VAGRAGELGIERFAVEPPSRETRLMEWLKFFDDWFARIGESFVDWEEAEGRINFVERPIFSEVDARTGIPVNADGSPGAAFQIMLRWAFSLGRWPPPPASGTEILDTPERALALSSGSCAVLATLPPV